MAKKCRYVDGRRSSGKLEKIDPELMAWRLFRSLKELDLMSWRVTPSFSQVSSFVDRFFI